MNQKFSAIVAVQNTPNDFDMPKTTIANLEREMTTPVTA